LSESETGTDCTDEEVVSECGCDCTVPGSEHILSIPEPCPKRIIKRIGPAPHPQKFDRALGIVPVGEALPASGKVIPLSAGEKFECFIRPTFAPSIAVVAVVGAGFSAQSKAQPGYGGGAAVFGQKTGAIAADYEADSLFARTLLPSLLHLDPGLNDEDAYTEAANLMIQ
jgi:hypothetical protein